MYNAFNYRTGERIESNDLRAIAHICYHWARQARRYDVFNVGWFTVDLRMGSERLATVGYGSTSRNAKGAIIWY